jgi:cob(I)alamin adenosyltransferase
MDKPATRRPRTSRKTSKSVAARKASAHKWSAEVTRESDALDLERGVFAKGKPADIARSLKRSAERSARRKSEPYRSAMSMLTFYINRAGKNLPKGRLRVLQQAKGELRKAYGRD